MGKFDGVLIASDLDGTLLDNNHMISEKNMKAIEYFTKNGGTFTVATGRPPISAVEVLKDIKFEVPAILLNGSVIFDMNTKKPSVAKTLGKDGLEVVNNVIKNFPEIGVEIFDINDIYLVNFSETSKKHFENINKPVELAEFSKLPDENEWLKVNFTHDSPEKLAELESFLIKNYNQYQLCYSCKFFLEITNQDARKDIGLFEMSDKLNFDRKHIYTVGDNFNDFHMLKNASKGFAPDNAEDEVKKVAFKVVSDCNNSAVADVIDYLDSIYRAT